jgi:type II secretory pathway pseudopilin PulG
MKNTQGFTIAEVIIIVAVLAVVLTMATPDMAKIFAKQSEITESIRMKKIYTALDLYAKEHRKLPAAANWAGDLVEYSELSEDQIQYDNWGTERRYNVFTKTTPYLGGNYTVYYAVVASAGIDRNNDVILPTNTATFANFDFTTDTSGNGVDDMAIKYTDQSYKLELLEITLDRMEKLSLALAKYARVKQIEAISANPENADQFIFFPKDARGPADEGRYPVGIDTISRSNEAVALTEVLGLPDIYGQDALTNNTMWYISNPGPDGSNICANSRKDAPYYPPVITLGASNPC